MHIAIDMTPMRPGGENGGVGILAFELIKGFAHSSAENKILIITASWNDEELSSFDAPNVTRFCAVNAVHQLIGNDSTPAIRTITERSQKLYGILPRKIRERLPRNQLRRIIGIAQQICGKLQISHKLTANEPGPLSARGIDALFCPFTAPTFAEPGIPVICLVCDLQHLDYPQFFSPHEINERDMFFRESSKKADVIVCISDTTRSSVVRHLELEPRKVRTIPICIQSRLSLLDSNQFDTKLNDLNISGDRYMFYPANFWPHKNHKILITAYAMYIARNPDSNLDLVLTGALDEARNSLDDKIKRMGLKGRVHILGYLSENQLSSVWKGCSFLIFPSLYEGFGIPILEAMEFCKPVLCSNLTSLPEVAGDAALYFDPRKPGEIVQCIERITTDRSLYMNLVERGQKNLNRYKLQNMIKQYLDLIEEIVIENSKFSS